VDVAGRAIQLAVDAARQKGGEGRTAQAGFCLIDKGGELERQAKVRRPRVDVHRAKDSPFFAGVLCGRHLGAGIQKTKAP
jgi:hypothetical protein